MSDRGWSEAPVKADPKWDADKDGARFYEIGWNRYLVKIAADGTVEYRDQYGSRYRKTDPRSVLPNLSIEDGVLRVHIEDLVEIIMSRMDPEKLAQELWSEDDLVRKAFMDALHQHYMGIKDEDRRAFLTLVQARVHSDALDKLGSAMAKLEYDVSQQSHFYHQINALNYRLQSLDVKDEQGEPLRLNHSSSDPEFSIGGKHWNEARDFWRVEIAKRFPGPEAP